MLPDPLSLIIVTSLVLPQPILPPLMTSVTPSSFRFASAALPPPSALMRDADVRPLRHPAAKKATAAVAGGIMGYFAGMLAGAAIGSLSHDENSVLAGAGIGASVGAVAGAVIGLRSAR